MAINPVQPNIDNKSHTPYREAQGAINTNNLVKPLPAQGHLVHDRLMSIPKFFVKDFIYDMKAVKDGFKGTANDHQLGRLNDVGIKVAGIGIAGYLASKTTNPVARVMEYAGLGAFLAAMSIYPQIAIQAPSRIMHGFDSGKEYIDDQGRKKSVMQDQNYIPFDMYRGEYPDEDLDIIGDKLGVPRNINNRHDLIKEQMRKISIQNNTLWMLTAGFATPVIAALFCVGLEKLLAPAIEKARNSSYNSKIEQALNKTQSMLDTELKDNTLSKQITKILNTYEGKELPKEEFNYIEQLLTKNLDSNTSQGIKDDLEFILKGETKQFSIGENTAEELVNNIKNNLPERNKASLEKIFVPSKDELSGIINRYTISGTVTEEQLPHLRDELKTFFDSKIASETNVSKEFLASYRNKVLDNITSSIKNNSASIIDSGKISDINEFAKIIGEFKKNDRLLDKCKSFKFEYAPETVVARSYSKFENTLLEVLDIKFNDIKQMKESETFTKEILDKKLSELAKDEVKYEKAVNKLAKVIEEMEVNLNGRYPDKSNVADLITAIENNFNNTAKRLDNIGAGKFKNTIDRLVKEDPKTLSNSFNPEKSREQVFDLLDGLETPKTAGINANTREYAVQGAKGAGSSKNLEISRIIERYQGSKNSFNRILHTMDFYKRTTDAADEFAKKCKDVLLTSNSSDHTLKLNTINSPEYYKNIMWNIYDKNKVTEATKNAIGESNIETGNVFDRFGKYIERFRDVMGNNNIDFMKPNHMTGGNIGRYSQDSTTRMAKFNLVSQSPVDMLKKAAGRKFGNQLWMRRVSAIGASVLGVTLLAQLGFGKISNPHNVQKKQVSDDNNN